MSQPPQPPNDPNQPPGQLPPAGQPMQGQPMQGQPMQGQPMQGQPMQGQDVYAQPVGEPLQPYAPPTAQPAPAHGGQGDATGGLIPYKNPPALIGYYVAIASLIPGIGNIAGLIALILGIIGLKKRRANPAIGGVVHAWIGIILGGGLFLAWNGCVIAGFLVPLLNR